MASMTSDQAPLGDLLNRDFGAMKSAMEEQLMIGISTGQGSKWIADRLMEVAEIPERRALVIARTEANRAYRQSNWEQMRSSRVTKGYRRMCFKPTACFACLMMDGDFYPIDAEPTDHPNGKCSFVPVTKHFDPMETGDWETGREWFDKLPPDDQRRIMGPGRYDIWQTEGLDPSKMVYNRENDVWGASPSKLRIDLYSVYDLEGVITSDGITITEVSNHFINQFDKRGINVYAAEEALTNPNSIFDASRPGSPCTRYLGDHAEIRVNPITGVLITGIKKKK